MDFWLSWENLLSILLKSSLILRKIMSDLLNLLSPELTRLIHLDSVYINGEWRPATGIAYDLYNPATAQVIATTHLASEAEMQLAVESARNAFASWSMTPPKQRADYLLAIADAMQQRFDDLVELVVLNNGKPKKEAQIDIQDAIDCYRYYADLASKLPEKQNIDLSATTFDTDLELVKLEEPIGVCACITPWNFPLVTTSWKLAPALAAGCTVILKPSEVILLPELVMGDILLASKLPKGVVNILPADGDVSAKLTAHPDIDKISFTGSNKVGQLVMAQAAKDSKSVSLELGGKSAIIVREDADLDHACEYIIGGIFTNAGQMCSATSRLLVHQAIAEALLVKLKEKVQALTIGNGNDTSTDMGPIVNAKQYQQAISYLKVAEAEGLKLLTGGKPITKQQGYYLAPTIYYDVPTTSRLWKEETFAPILACMTFSRDDEAVQLTNDSEFGLVNTIITQDKATAWQMAKQIRVGHVWINTPQIVIAQSGWGGFKQSGIGRELGEDGLSNYLASKHIMLPKTATYFI